jgi:hypothetical protein
VIIEEREVSRKTPHDGRLEISAEAAARLAPLGADFSLVAGGRAARGRVERMACSCAKGAGGGHEHHFVASPALTALAPGSRVRVELDEVESAVRVESA